MAGAASGPGEGRLGVVHLLLLHGAGGRHSVSLHQDVLLQGQPLSRETTGPHLLPPWPRGRRSERDPMGEHRDREGSAVG